jgi:hypothetical protein
MKAQAGDLHKHASLLAGSESPCRDNTIEGNVGVWTSRSIRLMRLDNGRAAP